MNMTAFSAYSAAKKKLVDRGLRSRMLSAIFLLAIGLAWLGSGLFLLARPESALRKTQWPWTRLPKWGMRLAGVIVVAGGGWILYFGMTKIHQ
jgi:uncharacterized protein YjeT (DUF2065 family)